MTTTLLSERQSIMRSTVELTQQSVQLLRVMVDQMIRDVDGLADGLQMVLAITPAASPLGVVDDATWLWLEQRMVERPAVRSYHLLDRDGVVWRSSLTALVGRSLAERAHFQVHRDGVGAGAGFTTGPFLSPPTANRELLISWPLRDAAGDLAGVLSVDFDTDVVEERLGRLVDGTHDIVALVRDDQAIMAAVGIGASDRLDPLHRDGGLASLVAVARTYDVSRGVVQRAQLFGAEAVWVAEAQPLAMIGGNIVMARNLDWALAGWRRHAIAAALGMGLLLAAIMASAAALTGLLERQGRALVAATTNALIDPLTSLFNRRMLHGVAGIAVARARRHGSDLALLLLDIDHFKAVNDRYGHAAGDAVLVAVAMQLKAIIRREDLLARIGGEEFAVLLPQLPPAAVLRQADRLREAIERLDVDVEGVVVKVTISIGIASLGRGEQTIETMLAAADAVLYRAKTAGRNRVVATDARRWNG